MKHDLTRVVPLQSSWTLSINRHIGPGRSPAEYADAIFDICELTNVHQFWSWFNNLPTASNLRSSRTYYLMKTGIRPVWEDSANVCGGTLSLRISLDEANEAWKSLCLHCIGEVFEQFLLSVNREDKLCGISVGIRKDEAVVSIWNAKSDNFDLHKHAMQLVNIVTPKRTKGERVELARSASYKRHTFAFN